MMGVISVIAFIALICVGGVDHSSYPIEKAQLSQPQSIVIANQLADRIIDDLPPAKTHLKLVHKQTAFSNELEHTFRERGYAVTTDKKSEDGIAVCYVTDWLSKNRLILEFNIDDHISLMGAYLLEGGTAKQLGPFAVKSNE